MQDRRDFLKQAALSLGAAGTAGAASMPLMAAAAPTDKDKDKAKAQTPTAEPTAAQKAWMDLGFGMFIHFGINTYYDVEWSDGKLDPSKYNPTELDCDSWMRAAKAAGMKYVVLVTKHHDGFCNWPTRYTDYSVKSTPWNKDLVGEVVKAARKQGLQVGFYYSLWDRHEKSHDTDEYAYVEFMKNQLNELLTQYGPIVELWFDGMWKKQSSGWGDKNKRPKPEEFMASWRNEGAYRWQMDHLYQYIKRLQPDIMVMNNGTTAFPGVPLFPVDIRSGEKAHNAKEDRKVWPWKGKDTYLPLQIETTMSQKGPKGDFQSGSWFWHDWDHTVASKDQILGWLETAKKLQANLLLNVGPMSNGKLRPEDENRLLTLRS